MDEIREDIMSVIGILGEYSLAERYSFNAEEYVVGVSRGGDGNDIIVHVMNHNDESRYVSFDNLDRNRQLGIYLSVCSRFIKRVSLDEFFDCAKHLLCSGDYMRVENGIDEDGEEDYDNLIYTIYNSCDGVIGVYSTESGIYRRY
jgi:hypothetical protein